MTDPHRLYGLIGHPIAHARSPALLNAYLAEHGLSGRAIAFDIRPGMLEPTLGGLRHIQNLHGFFVTMPFKERILALLDDVTETAGAAGAVNIVRCSPGGRLTGGQLDGAGFVGAMKAAGVQVAGTNVHVVGAGGVAAGICCALAGEQAARLAISNRSGGRAEALTRRLRTVFPLTEFATADGPPGPNIDIVVNATSLGLAESDPVPVDLSATRRGIFVGDVVNVARETQLLKTARERGCVVQRGEAMFPPQIPMALDFFAAER